MYALNQTCNREWALRVRGRIGGRVADIDSNVCATREKTGNPNDRRTPSDRDRESGEEPQTSKAEVCATLAFLARIFMGILTFTFAF